MNKFKRALLDFYRTLSCPYTVGEIDKGLADQWCEDFKKRYPGSKEEVHEEKEGR